MDESPIRTAMKPKSRPIPLSLPTDLLDRIDEVAGLMNRKRAQMIRDAIEVGLEYFRRCDYDLAAAVIDRGEMLRGDSVASLDAQPLPKAAETPESGSHPRRGKAVYRRRGPRKP
jgi:predicted DNA-binding protein